jgi:ribosomal protein S18 acetylase RimI-like enzyme
MKMEIHFSKHDASTAEKVLDSVVAQVYEASHGDVISNSFYSVERFVERVQNYVRARGFSLVAASAEGEAVGLAFGYVLSKASHWWHGLTTPTSAGFTEENGRRTFALNELMVVPEWQGRGVAHALHDQLLKGREEERATLLVREDNATALNAYVKWGWRKVGKLRPYPDAPHFDAMILQLPLLVSSEVRQREEQRSR